MSTLFAILFGVSVYLLIEGIYRLRFPLVGENLAEVIYGIDRNRGRRKSFFERRILPRTRDLAVRFAGLQGLSEPEEIKPLLTYAGDPYGMDEQQFLGYQVYLALVGLGCSFAYFMLRLPMASILLLGLPIGCFFYPRIWLRRYGNRRQHQISVSVPGFVDLLTIIIQSGATNLDGALREIVHSELSGPIQEELVKLMRDLELGGKRAEAYQNIIDRNKSEELRIVFDALLEGEELGVPVVETLMNKADDMRRFRLEKAKQQGARASSNISCLVVAVVGPTVFLLFLAMFILSFIYGQGAQF